MSAATPKKENSSVRLGADIQVRLDRVAAELTRRALGVVITGTDAHRKAVDLGLAVLERELGLSPVGG